METIEQFLNPAVQRDFRCLSENTQNEQKAYSALAAFLKKSLMELVNQHSKQKIVEISSTGKFQVLDAEKVLHFLKIDMKSFAAVLHSEELVVSIVHGAMKDLHLWGQDYPKEEHIARNLALFHQTTAIQKERKKGIKLNKTTNSVATKTKSSQTLGVEELQEMRIDDLTLFKVHVGCYVKGHLIGFPCVTTGVTHLLQDDKGSVTILGIYNIDNVTKNDDFDSLYPRNTCIIIKEPYYKIFDSGEKGIRVDDPKDIVMFKKDNFEIEPFPREITDDVNTIVATIVQKLHLSRSSGNEHFIKKQFERSASTYLEGLNAIKKDLGKMLTSSHPSTVNGSIPSQVDEDLCQLLEKIGLMTKLDHTSSHSPRTNSRSLEILRTITEIGLVFSNLSMCFKEMKFYHKAADFAQLTYHFEVSKNIKHKSHFRMFECQYLDGSRQSLTSQEWDDAKLVFSDKEVKRLEELQKQSLEGVFDWDRILEIHMQEIAGDKSFFDAADYIGPVRFDHIPGKGLGTIASRNLSKGDLIMATKALWQSERSANEVLSETIAPDLVLSGPQCKLVRELKSRIKDDPQLKKKIMALYAGPKFKRLDYIQVKGSSLADIDELTTEQIGYAVKFNTFGSNSGLLTSDVSNSYYGGLWFEPSFFNHDDNPNVCWVVMGNLLVARAVEQISAGTELTISYSCELRIDERKKMLEEYGFSYVISNVSPQVVDIIGEKSELISQLKIGSQKCTNDVQRLELLNKAIKINNDLIKKHFSVVSCNQPLAMGLLYDKMDLYLGVRNIRRAKEAVLQTLQSFACYVNEDYLQTILSSFPINADQMFTSRIEQCAELIYGSRKILSIYNYNKNSQS